MTHVITPFFHGESSGAIFAALRILQICNYCIFVQKGNFFAHFCTFLHISWHTKVAQYTYYIWQPILVTFAMHYAHRDPQNVHFSNICNICENFTLFLHISSYFCTYHGTKRCHNTPPIYGNQYWSLLICTMD